MNATRRDLEAQFNRVLQLGWLPWFQREAKRAGTTTSHLLGIGSRETNLKNIRGDFRNGHYNGFGVMQVDIGTDAAYARAWTPANVEPSIVRGVDIYLWKARDTKACVGKKTSIRSRSFVGRAVEADDLRRVSTAAYNCGRWGHYHFSRGEHVDSTTTGDDYSRDVYDRAVVFADILEERGLETMAVHQELALQGKYARSEARKQYGFEDLPERVKLAAGSPEEGQDELAAVDYERDTPDRNAFLVSDDEDEIDLFEDVSSPAAQTGSAGPNVQSDLDPALSAVEPGAGADPGLATDDAPAPPVPTPAGDAPNVAPSRFFSIEDWKPWAIRWASRIWKGVTTITLPTGGGLGFAAIKDPSNWWIYAIVAGAIILLLLGLGILATLVVAGVWLWQNRGIPAAKQEVMRIAADPNLKNVGISFVKK